MTAEELKGKYRKLYDYMAASNEPRYMRLFGNVMSEMMDWFIKNQPQTAEAWIEKLCAIKWEQYLSREDAMRIVSRLDPEAPWSYETWTKVLSQLGLEAERKSVFNSYALWVWANTLYSDQAETLAKYAFGMPLGEVPTEKLVTLIHALAVSNLTDTDGNFDIARYFGL